MKLEVLNLNNLVFYLNKDYLDKINFNINENVEQEFKNLFIKLKNIYNLELNGYYEVTVYVNDVYGIIIAMEKDDDEYIKIFGDTLDMKITFKFDCEIFYKIENIDFINFNNYNLYYCNNELFLSLKNNLKLSYKDYLYLLENSSIVYGNELKKLKSHMKKIL